MTRERSYELVSVNQERDLALGIFEMKGPRQRIHAVGRYYLDKNGESAEIAFVVRESKRRCGMGTFLLKRMLKIAKRRGLKRLWAYVMRNNEAMLRCFERNGGVITPGDESDTVQVVFNLTDQDKD